MCMPVTTSPFPSTAARRFGIVGESGCGKTTTGKALVKIVKPTSGVIRYEGKDIYRDLDRRASFAFCRKMQIIFQDPFSSLDPRFTVQKIIQEPLDIHRVGTRAERRKRVEELMQEVEMHTEQLTKFPHEFSGGQRQRIGIARALALNPEADRLRRAGIGAGRRHSGAGAEPDARSAGQA